MGIFLSVDVSLLIKEWYSLRRFLKIYRGVVYPVQVCSFPTSLIKKRTPCRINAGGSSKKILIKSKVKANWESSFHLSIVIYTTNILHYSISFTNIINLL